MGNKVSSLTGVRSSHFYEPGNAVNEIWLGDFELISHLPFGAPDIDQTGFQKDTHYPMIPWKPFLIPLSGGGGSDGRAVTSKAEFTGKLVKRAMESRSNPPSVPQPAPYALNNPLYQLKGKILPIKGHLPTGLEVDFVCWLVMQALAVLSLLVPIWLAVEMLVRAFESPIVDEESDECGLLSASGKDLGRSDLYSDSGSSSAASSVSIPEDRSTEPARHDRNHFRTGRSTFLSTLTRASIGSIFYLLSILLMRAHDIAMHISPECMSILTAPIMIHSSSEPGYESNAAISQYPSPVPPSTTCPSSLPKYPEDIDKYIPGSWSGPYRYLMTSLCVLAVFAVGCLWSDVILIIADETSKRKAEGERHQTSAGTSLNSDADILRKLLYEEKRLVAKQRTPERLIDSSDAIRTLVS
ncbi:hypothetical protein KEM54_004666 [Ascosphaera aggregata]|nr:hypothetical protein KEM54_004666 [Ascosphaera aggregata]